MTGEQNQQVDKHPAHSLIGIFAETVVFSVEILNDDDDPVLTAVDNDPVFLG